MILYRFAKKEDFEQVFDIENECFKEPYSRDELKYEFEENPVNKIIVAYDGDLIVGFIDYLITFNSSTIMQIAVTESYRKQGIASELLNKMESTYSKKIEDKVESITLEVRESNLAAKKLYEKNGYEFVVLKDHYYKDGENAIYMVKRL